MNTHHLLSDSVEALHILRAELLGNVKDSVIETLDKVINDLEVAQLEDPSRYSATELLLLLGSILKLLPTIVEAVNFLSQLLKNTPN